MFSLERSNMFIFNSGYSYFKRAVLYFAVVYVFLFGCTQDGFNNKNVFTNCDHCIKFSEMANYANFYEPVTLWFDFDLSSFDSVFINHEFVLFADTISFLNPGFYSVLLKRDYFLSLKKFTIIDEKRGESEWGLNTWTPSLIYDSSEIVGDIKLFYPKNVTSNLKIPIVLYTLVDNEIYPNYSSFNLNNTNARIKRGVGSILYETQSNSNFQIDLNNKSVSGSVNFIEYADRITISDTISDDVCIEANSLLYFSNNVFVKPGVTIEIKEGSLVLINEGVTIYNEGSFIVNGKKHNPVFFTSNNSSEFWGGFVSVGDSSNIEVTNAFFSFSGYHENGEFNLGHGGCQALFQLINSNLSLNNSFCINNKGQIFFTEFSELQISNTLIQKCKTGGQLNNTVGTIDNCIFTDFPDDNDLFQDNDNDALYISENCDLNISNSVFMYAKDDGLDSGSADGGNIVINNCVFESCFHEGAALSSYNGRAKRHEFNNCIFSNCGQGLELGFSDKSHQVFVNQCVFKNNYVGIRYGDNYSWSDPRGTLYVNNSLSINNHLDVWNMVRSEWGPLLDNMVFSNVTVSKYSYQYPDLEVLGN